MLNTTTTTYHRFQPRTEQEKVKPWALDKCAICGNARAYYQHDDYNQRDAVPATTQAQPTPTPWHVASDEVTIVKPHVQANSEFAKQQGYIVARSCFSREESADTPKGGQWTEETKANARFIVKAVNNHQKLVDALSFVRDALDRHLVNQDDDLLREDLDDMDETVRAALAEVQADAD